MREDADRLPAKASAFKAAADFWLSKVPRLYLLVENRRRWDNWDKRVFLSVIRPGDVVADIGANVGIHTLTFSNLTGASGEVFAFEPLPGNLAGLAETLDVRARFANVTVISAAVGNPSAIGRQVVMNIPGDDLTQASLGVQTEGSWAASQKVRQIPVVLTSLDHEVEARRITRLDLVKIDVEGAELDVIKGGAKILAKLKPLLYCEVYEKWMGAFGYGAADIFEELRALGYAEARVIRAGKWLRLPLASKPPAGTFDVSCNALFSTPAHSARLRRFDQLYGKSWR